MTSISNVGGITPDDGSKAKKSAEPQQKDPKDIKIFDTDNDGILSAEEQKAAVAKEMLSNKTITTAKKFGFDANDFLNTLAKLFKDINLKDGKIGHYLISPTQIMENARKTIQNALSVVEENAKDFINNNELSKLEPNMETDAFISVCERTIKTSNSTSELQGLLNNPELNSLPDEEKSQLTSKIKKRMAEISSSKIEGQGLG